MQFKNAMDVDSICYQMRLADYPRGVNRARIDELFNGVPPYNEEEEQARVGTNTKKIVLAVEEALEMLRDGTAHTNRDAGIALAPKYGLSAHYIETKIGEARQDGKSTKRGRPRKS